MKKKLIFGCAVAVLLSAASCNGGSSANPKDLKTANDSLSYYFGEMWGSGYGSELKRSPDSARVNKQSFIKGLETALSADTSDVGYIQGLAVGSQLSQTFAQLKKQEKIESELNKYQASSDYIKEHKLVMLKTIVTTYIQFLAYYSVSYWVYRSFGLNEYNILKIISIQSVLYGTVSGIPSPGAVGVTEGGFIEIFKTVFPKNSINGAMILNRGINFYLLIVISAVITMTNAIKFQKMEEKNTENNEEIS